MIACTRRHAQLVYISSGHMAEHVDPGLPRMPTEEEFQMFFLYTAYDCLSERSNSLEQLRAPQQQQDMQYRKFVQSNKETDWGRGILASVAAVQATKNHYKTLLPMLLNRNMAQLHKVCVDITTNNNPPHKEASLLLSSPMPLSLSLAH